MSWLLPSALGLGAAAAIAIVALHFIARSRPMAEPLPTARFIPPRRVHARSRSVALTDLILLATRVLAVILLAAGVAGPVATRHARIGRVIAIDRSRAVASAGELRDSARALIRPGDAVVVFDSVAVPRPPATVDSLEITDARGSLSVGLVRASRAAVAVAAQSDSVELVLLSPLAREELDAATARVRASWPGRVRVVRVRAHDGAAASSRIDVTAPENDAVAAGLSLMPRKPSAPVRVVRGRATAADSAWARVDGHALVIWPATITVADWPSRGQDAIGGVASSSGTMIGRFSRPWTFDGAAIARWSDGKIAAREREAGAGCIRDVAVLIDPASDVTLHAPFRAFASALFEPCGGARDFRPLDDAATANLAGAGGLAAASLLRDTSSAVSEWTPWLLALGALLLIAELALRRPPSRPA